MNTVLEGNRGTIHYAQWAQYHAQRSLDLRADHAMAQEQAQVQTQAQAPPPQATSSPAASPSPTTRANEPRTAPPLGLAVMLTAMLAVLVASGGLAIGALLEVV